MAEQQFSLCWDNFHKNMSIGMQNLLENEDLVDVTIAVEGKYLKAHKTMLSVCSPYFKELFQTNPCKHPIVIMKDVSYIAMNDLLTFMYQGEVQVSQEHLSMFIKTAEALQIKGLTGDGTENMELIEENVQSDEVTFKPVTIEHKPKVKQVSHPPSKRRRLSQNSDKHSPSTEEIIEFKMEPFDDVEQHLNESYENIEDHNETFKEGVEEVQVEDTGIIDHEDYSLLEGEDEAKPGTSNEVGTESQDALKTSPTSKISFNRRKRYVANGFVYHCNLISGRPPLRYLGCAEVKRLGCKARAVVPLLSTMSELILKHGHNHPPDMNVEEKDQFLMELRRVVGYMNHSSLRHIYETVAKIYPKAAAEIPFKSICSSLHRWRRNRLNIKF